MLDQTNFWPLGVSSRLRLSAWGGRGDGERREALAHRSHGPGEAAGPLGICTSSLSRYCR